MPELHLSSSFGVLVLLGAAGTALGASILAYRATVPPVSPAQRWTLTLLRSAGLYLLFVLIGEPLLTVIQRAEEPPSVLLLIDNSESMAIRDRLGDRRAILGNVLKSDALRSLELAVPVRAVSFDRTVRPMGRAVPDSLTLRGSVTNIAAALRYAQTAGEAANIRAVVLVTDGNVTEGANPVYEAQELGLPVFTVGVGDSLEQKDLIVRSVLTNDVTYKGNRVPVQATIHSAGFAGERVEVVLRGNGDVLDRSMLTLDAGSRDYRVSLAFTAKNEGRQKLTTEVSSLPGELTNANNKASFFVRVLKSKMKVVLLTGVPSMDVAFVRRALGSDPNVDLQAFVGGKNGEFSVGQLTTALLAQVDCLVLVGLPEAGTPVQILDEIRQAAESGKPLLIILSRSVDIRKLDLLTPAMPFTVQNPLTNELQVFPSVPDRQRQNAIMRLDDAMAAFDGWSAVAPVFRWQSGFRAKAESEVLAYVRFQSATLTDPLILSRNVNRHKSIAVTGYGVWRWNMLADVPAGSTPVLDRFLSNSVRWLTTRDEDRRVQVQPVRQQVTAAEPVEFAALVYDESYRPLDGAQVSVTIRSGLQTVQLDLASAGNGQYTGSADPLPEGEYTFTASAKAGAATLGDDQGAFSVGRVNTEFLETRLNRPLLEQLAIRSGGKFYGAGTLDGLAQDVRALPTFVPREQVKISETDLWNSPWLLGAVVLLFGTEWLLRKLWGMI